MLVQGGERMPGCHRHGICGSGLEVFVRVPDVGDVHHSVRGEAKVIDPLETKAWGDREFTVADPDGTLITFYMER
jgi:uncharacterized glyoxalase superfamily protein PhnB